MRRVNFTETYNQIRDIRVNVFENILIQIVENKEIDYNANKYLKRIESLNSHEKINALISKISSKNAREELTIIQEQNRKIKNNIICASKHRTSKKINGLAEYIYNNILFNPTYWKKVDGVFSSKMTFKEKFFDAQKNAVCPYCDSFEDLSLLSFEIDHLLPKSSFPLLYINEMNLFPCCKTCNHQHHGKGNRWNKKYYNMFKNTIGLKAIFKFKGDLEIKGKDRISGDFLKLIKLESRLNKKTFKNKICLIKKKVLKDIKNKKTNRNFIDKNAPNYFLIKKMYDYLLKEYR